MDFGLIINQIIVLFIVIFIGYLIRRINLIDDYVSQKMASIVIYVTTPCIIIHSMTNGVDIALREIIILVIISIFVYIFLYGMSIIIPKLLGVKEGKIGLFKFMIFFSNVAFIGFPVGKAIFGDVAIVYASVFNLPFNLLVFTLGVYFVTMDSHAGHQFEYKKLVNPAIIAVFIGFFLFFSKIQLPYFLGETISMVGDLNTPLSMMIIGTSLVHANIKTVFKDYRLILLSIIKLFVIPVILYFALKALGFTGLMLGIPVVIIGMPVAAISVILCKAYGGDDVLASEGVFISTILSLVSIPFLAFLLTL